MTAVLDPYQAAARIMRERVRDKSYRAYALGQAAGEYLRWKRGRITPATYRSYESCLDKLAREFPDLEITDFEPPVGTQRLEEFMDTRWGELAAGTFNTNHAILRDFFKWAVLRGKLHGDPMLAIQRHKKRGVHRETFSRDDRSRILADGPAPGYLRRDRIALRLLLKYGIRKGALQKIQFKHFDQGRRRLTIFTKGGKVQELPIVDVDLWDDVAKLILELGAEQTHYLMFRRKEWDGLVGHDARGRPLKERRRKWWLDQSMSAHGLHDWWYGCLQRAGIVSEGVASGERMHKSRHTAGQNVLDATGNIKAVQKLLGHSSAKTTMDTYVDWDVNQLEETMRGLDD